MLVPSRFSLWMRNNLKDAYSGLITQDIDFIVTRNDNHYFIVEEKIYSHARTGPAQAIIYKLLNDILSTDVYFEGCHKVTVNNDYTLYINQTESVSFEKFIKNPKSNYINEYGQTWFDQIINFYSKYLWDCYGISYVQKTEKEHTLKRKSLLENIFLERKIKTSSIDWIFLNYCSGNFAFFFEKAEVDQTVKNIIKNLEKYNSYSNKVFNPKSKSKYKFLGVYFIEYDETISEFKINGNKVPLTTAIKAFNLENELITSFMK